jgi:hypothetical protein
MWVWGVAQSPQKTKQIESRSSGAVKTNDKSDVLEKKSCYFAIFFVYIYIARWSSKKMRDSRAEVGKKMYDERAKKCKMSEQKLNKKCAEVEQKKCKMVEQK